MREERNKAADRKMYVEMSDDESEPGTHDHLMVTNQVQDDDEESWEEPEEES
jgi:hypothetical protein